MAAHETTLAMEHVVFMVPIALVLGWLCVSLVMGHLIDADGDLDVDGDVDVDGDLEVEADGADIDLIAFLGFFGAKHLPLLLWLQILVLLWGVVGLTASLLGAPLWLASLAATMAAPTATALISRALRRVLPSKRESEALPLRHAVGLIGRVTSTRVDTRRGEGSFQGKNGNTLYLPIRVEDDDAVIAEHRQVVIVDIDESEGIAYVIATEDLALGA